MTQITTFKMVTGEEVIAEVVESRSGSHVLTEDSPTFKSAVTTYILKRPHTLQFQQLGRGQVGLALVPWTLSNPDIRSLELPATAVLLTFAPSEEVEKQYLQQTSGISLSTAV
jgi:hypothetical protein